jgi:hypothetical protein
MVANTSPIFIDTPNIGGIGNAAITAANTAKDGTGTVTTVFTAGADGAFVQKLRARPIGTNVATVMRIFINNGSATSTATNNILYDEITLPATTLSEVAALALYELPLNIALPAGYKLTVTLGTAVAAGYFVSVVGGDY